MDSKKEVQHVYLVGITVIIGTKRQKLKSVGVVLIPS